MTKSALCITLLAFGWITGGLLIGLGILMNAFAHYSPPLEASVLEGVGIPIAFLTLVATFNVVLSYYFGEYKKKSERTGRR